MKEEGSAYRKSIVFLMMAASAFVIGFVSFFFSTISQAVDAGESHTDVQIESQVVLAAPQSSPPLSFYEQAVAFYAAGQYQDAVISFSRAIEQSPNNAELFARRGSTYLALNRLDQAARDFEQAMLLSERLARDGWLIYYNAGKTAYGENRYGDALQYFSRSIEFAPSNYMPFFQRAEVYSALGHESYAAADYRQAATLLGDMIALNPTDPELYRRRAMVYQKLGENSQVLSDLLTIIELEPADPESYRIVGWFYVVQSQYEEALPYYQYAIRLSPQNPETYGDVGWLYFRLHDYPQSIAYYTAALERDPGLFGRRLERADVYLVAQHFLEAIADYTYLIDVHAESLATDRNLSKVHNRRAWAYAALSQYDLAVADQIQALSIEPDDETFFRPYFELNIDLGGERDSLIGFYERLLDINPVDHVVAERLADLLGLRGQEFYFVGNYDAAVADFSRLKQLEPLVQFMILDPDQALTTIFYHRALTYEAKGEYVQAIQDYHRVGRYRGYSPELVLHLGDLYYRARDFGNALAYYEYSMQLGVSISDDVVERINSLRLR